MIWVHNLSKPVRFTYTTYTTNKRWDPSTGAVSNLGVNANSRRIEEKNHSQTFPEIVILLQFVKNNYNDNQIYT
jgi:hypothetical protein